MNNCEKCYYHGYAAAGFIICSKLRDMNYCEDFKPMGNVFVSNYAPKKKRDNGELRTIYQTSGTCRNNTFFSMEDNYYEN